MPSLRSAAPTFLVHDVGATAQWYGENFGFTASFFPKAPPYVYASLQRDGVEIILLRQENYRKAEITRAGGVWDAYIRVQDVEALYEEVRQRTTIKSELVNRPYGDTEFEVADLNGYVLVFGG